MSFLTWPSDMQAATGKLIESLQQENANMKVTAQPQPITVDGERALSTYLRNDSPAGGQETDWLVTSMRTEGLLYFVFVAPESGFKNFSAAFSNIVDSIQFSR